MPDDYRLRRVPAPDAPSGSGRNNKSPANAVAADAAAIEDIIRRTLQEVHSTNAPGSSTSNGNPAATPPASAAAPDAPSASASSPANNTEDVASLRTQLSSLQKTYNEAIQALEQGRLAYQTLEHKHQQFVDANVAFTHWRDDMERQRAAWADANAKFAKRHEEHKAARANLEAKYSAVLGDLEELKERYERAKKEIERLSGQAPPPSPPLPSAVARPGDPLGPLEKRKKSSISGVSTTTTAARSVRGVERDASGKELHHRQPVYPPQLVEQSVLRERLTSDMFTLSQKAGHPSAISPTTTTSSTAAASSTHPRSPPALQPSSSSPYHYPSSQSTYAHSPRQYPPPGPPIHSPYPPPPSSPRDRDQQQHHHHHARYPHAQPPPPLSMQHHNFAPPPPNLAPSSMGRTLPPLQPGLPSPASSTWRSPGLHHQLPSVLPPPSGQLPPPLMSAHSSSPPPLQTPSRRRGREQMDVNSLVDGDPEEAARRKKPRRSDPYPHPSSSGHDGRTPGRSPP
ncbi:hypothetical protein FRC04_007717 [Tulasnella sp. 424]|nr:hypothetical protein FRC04_007717 [Tulasnella sp. 424]